MASLTTLNGTITQTVAILPFQSAIFSPPIARAVNLTTSGGTPATAITSEITILVSNLTFPEPTVYLTLIDAPLAPSATPNSTTPDSNDSGSSGSGSSDSGSSDSGSNAAQGPSPTGESTECSTGGTNVGKAVGIGIGSALAAALLLALGAAACFWHRRSSRKPRHVSHTGEFLMGPIAKASSSVSSGQLQDKLPQPITRKDIEKEASRLEGAIRNYVENFTDCQTSSKRHYDGLKLNTSDLSEYSQYRVQWATLLQDNSKRYDALRMFIARVLEFRTSANGVPSSTLLPAEVLQMYQQIVAGRDKDEHVQNVWRTLTADLLSTTYSTSTTPLRSTDPRSGALEDTVAIIMKALEPFRLKHQGSETREHEMLIELVAKAALLGLRLFMQTTPTELFWTDTSSHGRVSEASQHMEVFPGVRQWAGTKGSRPDIIRGIVTQ